MHLKDIPYSHTRAPWPKRPPLFAVFNQSFFTERNIRNTWYSYYLWRPFRWLVIGSIQIILIFICKFIKTRWLDAIARFCSKKYVQPMMAKQKFAQDLPERIKQIDSSDELNRKQHIKGVILEKSESQLNEIVNLWWENTTLSYSRFAHLQRYYQTVLEKEPISEHHAHLLKLREQSTPLLFAAVHLGDWELIVNHIGDFPGLRPICTTYEPRKDDFHNEIIYQRRKKLGVYVFPPGNRSARYLSQLNHSNHTDNLIFIDEEIEALNGKSVFPLFGRENPGKCNARRLVRMAIKYQRPIVPIFLLRNQKKPFNDLHFLPLIHPMRNKKPSADLENELLVKLSDLYEPIIRQNIEQWYMLASTRFS